MIAKVPILLYHGIAESSCDQTAPFTVSPATFERHLDAVLERGYRCLTVSQFIDHRKTNGVENDKIALITFDDGYADFVEHAIPAMTKRNIASTIYITTGWMDGDEKPLTHPDDPMMSWKQVAELPQAEVAVEVGSHSHSHPHMDTLSRASAGDELIKSKELLENALARPVRSFAYPHGYSHARLRRQVAATGYDSGAAVRSACSHVNDDAFRLARLMVFNDTSFETIEQWLDTTTVPLAPRIEHPNTTKWRLQRRAKSFIERRPRTDYA